MRIGCCLAVRADLLYGQVARRKGVVHAARLAPVDWPSTCAVPVHQLSFPGKQSHQNVG